MESGYCHEVHSEDPPLQGSLATTPLPALLARVAGQRFTGALVIENRGDVWLADGRTYLATTPTSPDLSAVLADPVSSTPSAAPPAPAGAPGVSVDDIVVQHPGVENYLRRLLHEHSLNALFEILVATDATYRIEPGVTHPIGPRFAEDTGELVAKAEQRLGIWRRIATRIPTTGAVFTLSTALPPGTEERVITADEWRFLSRLDGRNTVADIVTDTGESAFRVCSVLYRLLLEGLVVEADS